MKTTIEIHGFEIVIDETEEGVTVSASKEGEVVEEFTLEGGEEGSEEESGDDIKGFEDFGDDEEEDFGDDEPSEDDEMPSDDEPSEDDEMPSDDEDADADDESQLESFQSFINKKKKK